MPEELHIASLLVLAHPEAAEAVAAEIGRMPGAEVQARTAQRLVVTLETMSQGDVLARMNDISLLPGVMSAALVYHQWLPVDQEAPSCSQPAAT